MTVDLVIVCIGSVIVNVVLLSLNLKLYTEMFKEIAQQRRTK